MRSVIPYILLFSWGSHVLASGIYESQVLPYDTSNIPSRLLENANAVIRDSEKIFRLESPDRATLTERYAITILNRNGSSYADFNEVYGTFSRIGKLRATLYDSHGRIIDKIRPDDFEDYSIASGYTLYDDSRRIHYNPLGYSYPYTIEYSFKVDYNGLLDIPDWSPVPGFGISTEKSSYAIHVAAGLHIKYLELNLDFKVRINEPEGYTEYLWQAADLQAIEPEPYSPPAQEYIPMVLAAPVEFEMDGYAGTMGSWEEFGAWQAKLLEGRNELPEETVRKIHDLTSGMDDKREITREVYKYLQSRTRYISIQEGIGGWQPFPAETVDRLGYGDCKALANYCRSLLAAAGIESFYTKVRAGRYETGLRREFVSNQSNHIILCVPLDQDTIWLECTNQKNPPGYIGHFTDNRNAMIITGEGGAIVRTRRYEQAENCQYRSATVNLNPDGSGNARVTTRYSGLQYDNVSGILDESFEEKKKWLYRNLGLTNIRVEGFSYLLEGNEVPEVTESIDLKLNRCATVMGKRYFIVLNLLNRSDYIPEETGNRKTDVWLRFPFIDADTITYILPEGYRIESCPEEVSIQNRFGSLEIVLDVAEKRVTYIRIRKMNEGVFPPDTYPELLHLFRSTASADRMTLVLVRSE